MGKESTRVREPDGEVRQRLLEAAADLFTKKGYAGTTVREIVTAAGVTPPVLYYYFQSKEGLFLTLMKEPGGSFEAKIDGACRNGATAQDRLRSLCLGVLELFQENLAIARLMYSVYYGPPQGAPFFNCEAYHDTLRTAVQELVEQGIRDGEFSCGNVDGMLWAVMGALNVALELELSHPETALGANGLSRVLDVVFGGMAANVSERKKQ